MPLKNSLSKPEQKIVYNLFKKGAPVNYIAKKVTATEECVKRFTPEKQDEARARIERINHAANTAHMTIMDGKHDPAGSAAKAVQDALLGIAAGVKAEGGTVLDPDPVADPSTEDTPVEEVENPPKLVLPKTSETKQL